MNEERHLIKNSQNKHARQESDSVEIQLFRELPKDSFNVAELDKLIEFRLLSFFVLVIVEQDITW